jgi:hypothetical protein
MRLTRADHELLDLCRPAIGRSTIAAPRMAEVGSRKAEIASVLMREYAKLLVHLLGDWGNFGNIPWNEGQDWEALFLSAQLNTVDTPPRRRMHLGDPNANAFRVGQYELVLCCFSDDRHVGNLYTWHSRVMSSGVLCGVRSPTADATISQWTRTCGIQFQTSKRIWWIEKPR